MKRKPLQVSLHVKQPSVVELTVGDKVQLDRLTPVSLGYEAARHGDLIEPGVTTLRLDQGFYFFKTLSEAHLRVVQGGVEAATAAGGKDPWPQPPPAIRILPVPTASGDEPAGDAPALTVEHTHEEQR
jgi:hypothetical protein